MSQKKQSSNRNKKKTTVKRVIRGTVRRGGPIALATPTRVVRRGGTVNVQTPPPKVDTIVTETDIVTQPKVEVRRPATLSQALTEPAEIVVKPETKIVRRTVKSKHRKIA
jgi:hypothetical protein